MRKMVVGLRGAGPSGDARGAPDARASRGASFTPLAAPPGAAPLRNTDADAMLPPAPGGGRGGRQQMPRGDGETRIGNAAIERDSMRERRSRRSAACTLR